MYRLSDKKAAADESENSTDGSVIRENVPIGYTAVHSGSGKDSYASLASLRQTAQHGHFDIPRLLSASGFRSLSVAALQAWNQLPADTVNHIATFLTFKNRLKTFLFHVTHEH